MQTSLQIMQLEPSPDSEFPSYRIPSILINKPTGRMSRSGIKRIITASFPCIKKLGDTGRRMYGSRKISMRFAPA
jgi:hypothetical protein